MREVGHIRLLILIEGAGMREVGRIGLLILIEGVKGEGGEGTGVRITLV